MTDEQLSLDTVASEARARTTDPWTSHAAAASITEEQLRESQRAVLECFRYYGKMHHELLVSTYGRFQFECGRRRQSESGLRTRTKELRDAGFIEDTGETVRLPSGRQSKVWRATS